MQCLLILNIQIVNKDIKKVIASVCVNCTGTKLRGNIAPAQAGVQMVLKCLNTPGLGLWIPVSAGMMSARVVAEIVKFSDTDLCIFFLDNLPSFLMILI